VATLAALYLIAVNLAAFAVFAVDKQRAMAGAPRVPERTLLQLAALGGSGGALAAQGLLRHKTRKEPFRTYLALIVVVQAVVAAGLLAFAGG
jgi:uncharacterized membrane protein YsdA (DUF1294 family)